MKVRILILSLLFIAMMAITPIATNISFNENMNSQDELTADNNDSLEASSSNPTDAITDKKSVSTMTSDYEDGKTAFEFDNNKTRSYLNSSFTHPGNGIEVNTTSEYVNTGTHKDWTTEGYNNTYYYSLSSPEGELVFNSTEIDVTNQTVHSSTPSDTWEGQTLNSTVESNFTSYWIYPENTFVTNISFGSMTNVTATVVKISFSTIGKAIGLVRYSTDNTTVAAGTEVSGRAYTTSHVIYLRNLNPDTTYYFEIEATDYFTENTITDNNNGSNYYFKTEAVDVFPVISNMTITPSNNTAIVTFNVTPSANATIFYGLVGSALSFNTTNDFNIAHEIVITNLLSATKYYFKLELYAADGNKTVNTNDGAYFIFTTKAADTSAVVNSSVTITQYNRSYIGFTFTTDKYVRAQVRYGTSVSSVTQTSIISPNSTTHEINITVSQLVTYFYEIYLLNPNGLATLNLNNSNSQYYQYTTLPFRTVLQNDAYINVTLEIPNYPAVLGVWKFQIYIQKNDTSGNIINVPTYNIYFLVNDTLGFSETKEYLRRGTKIVEGEEVANYLEYDPTTYSPGDNVSLIGHIQYSDASTINLSEISISGSVDLIFGNDTYETVGSINILPYDPLVGINTSIYEDDTYVLVNFQIPLKAIYGTVNVSFNVVFPGNQSYSSPGFTQVSIIDSLEMDVKYVLGVTKTPIKSNYYLTERFNGYITIQPFHYDNAVNFATLSANNYTRALLIPANEIKVNITIFDESNTTKSLVQIQQNNYSWFWLRESLDFGISAENYTMKFADSEYQTNIVLVTNISNINPAATAYEYEFKISASYALRNMMSSGVFSPGETINVRFKIVVPQTDSSWEQDLIPSVTIDSGSPLSKVTGQTNPTFSALTGEYSIPLAISESATTGNYTVRIVVTNKVDATITITVDSDVKIDPSVTKTTPTVQDSTLDLLDFGLVGLGVVGGIVYLLVAVVYMKRK